MSEQKWVAAWGNAMSISNHIPQEYSRNITFRYPVFIPFSGSCLRLTFDNFCGTEAIVITKATVGLCSRNNKKEVLRETILPVTFSGNTFCRLAAGSRQKSDPVFMNVQQGQMLAVTFYLADFTQMRSSVIITGPLSGGQYAVGDCCTASVFPVNHTRNTNCYYFLSDVELLTSPQNRAVICYGDSITAQDWPDDLALLFAGNPHNNTSVIRKAASGTRILRQYDCITYESYGLMGKIRFPHELPAAGADTLIIQQGINDIIHPVGTDVNIFRPMQDLPTIEELENGYLWYLKQAAKLGLRTFAGTLLPIEGWRTYASFRETMKNEFNNWLRQAPLCAGCIDFDAAVRDISHPQRFAEGFDSGDHLHPSAAAYRAMAKTAFEILSA